MSLSVSNLVNVTVSLTQAAAAGRSFGVLMIAGDSNVISGLERFRTYIDINDVANDFGVTAPEYLAASLYFGQSPQPSTCMIGRWIAAASAAENIGGIISPSAQVIQNWTAITSGGFSINIDGTVQNLTALNFSGATNLNGVAALITAGLSSGATCVWDGTEFKIISGTTGAGAFASGTIQLTANPSAADTLTLGGTAITFVASGATGSQVNIGGNNLITCANLLAFLQASVDTNISKCTYALVGNTITATYKILGTGGNAFSLAKSSTAITLSAGDLAGGVQASAVGFATTPGSGIDISGLLGLTSALSQGLVPGYAAESAVQCVEALANASTGWYGLMFASQTSISDSNNLAVCAFIEALAVTRVFGITIQNTNVLSSLITNDLASLMVAGEYEQCFSQYSSTNAYAVASFFGRAFSVDFTAQNSTIDLMYKQEPGVVPESLSQSQANVLQAKRCNVYATYNNGTQLIQYGVMSGPAYFDEIHGIDWFQNAIQTALFNVLYTSTTKVPQTDAGMNQLTNAAGSVCDQAVFNGLAGPGTWNGPSFGQLQTGNFLKPGYYVYAQPIAFQSQSDRDARVAPPIQIALKLAGAINTVNVLVTVNQ